MLRGLVSRLISALLIAVVSSGGGGLPVVDGLLFHSRDAVADALRPHLEATSGCHADGCAMRSSANHSRFALTVKAARLVLETAEPGPSRLTVLAVFSETPSGQPFSRAPPRSS